MIAPTPITPRPDGGSGAWSAGVIALGVRARVDGDTLTIVAFTGPAPPRLRLDGDAVVVAAMPPLTRPAVAMDGDTLRIRRLG